MSVTESKAKTERKSSRKPAKTQETVLSALLAQTEEVSVPLASLIKSPLNVRTVPYSAESVSELADSIKGVGLLQNLVVHALPGDRYGVAAGGRRLAALNMLAERDIIPADWPVRVKVIPQELATAASMTENGHRRDMHPAEQIAGFRAMAQEGKTPAQIGDLLGYSPRHVQRMLKLADLAPVILDALAEDRITTEHCQALALENDTARQVQVFEAACQSGWGGKPEVQTIRRLVTESEVAVAGNSKFRFVGADTFSPDELRTDLFSDDEGGYVDCVALDAALLEKLQAVAEHLREAEGWEWCAGRMEPVGFCREDAGTYRSLPEPEAVLTEAEEERLNELMARYDALKHRARSASFPFPVMQQNACSRRCGFVSGNAVAINPRWSCRSTAASRRGRQSRKPVRTRRWSPRLKSNWRSIHRKQSEAGMHAGVIGWQSMTWKPCSGSGASVFRHWPEWNAGSGRICHSGRLSRKPVWQQRRPVMLSVRWSGGWCRTNSGRCVMRQQSHGLPVNSLNERVIFRKSECGQRAGIWAMMCPALEAFCLMT